MNFTTFLNGISPTNFSYLNGVTSPIQIQIDNLTQFAYETNSEIGSTNFYFNNFADYVNLHIQGITYDLNTDTTTIDNNLNVTKNISFSETINGISSSVFSFLGSVTSNIQEQFNNMSVNVSDILQRITAMSYVSANNTTYFSSALSFANNINNITTVELAQLSGTNTNIKQDFNNLPRFQFRRVRITGNSSFVFNHMSIPGNTDPNYAVFPTFYYGRSVVTGGTYDLNKFSTAVYSEVIITEITVSGFKYWLRKATGDNVNVDIHFLIIWNTEYLDYAKSWTE